MGWTSGFQEKNRNFVGKAHDTRYSNKESAILYHGDIQTYQVQFEHCLIM